jgi:hypothetical protein
MPNFDCLNIKFTIIDDWTEINEKWNYIEYMIVLINDKLWLWEKEI